MLLMQLYKGGEALKVKKKPLENKGKSELSFILWPNLGKRCLQQYSEWV